MTDKKYVYMLKRSYYKDARPYQDEIEDEKTIHYETFEKALQDIQTEYNKKIQHPDLEMKGIEIDKDKGEIEAYITIQTYKRTYSVFTQYEWKLTKEEIKK